jgi:hypothetical protein
MLSRFFQQSDHLLALYAWEPLEELLDRIARFQMIKQTFHRHARPSKNRLTAENLRVLRYDAAHPEQNTAWPYSSQKRCSSAVSFSTFNNRPSTISFETRSLPALSHRYLAALPSISAIPRLDSCVPAFLINSFQQQFRDQITTDQNHFCDLRFEVVWKRHRWANREAEVNRIRNGQRTRISENCGSFFAAW